MVTDDEIDRRIADKDTTRSARRSAAAKRISNLAERHAILSAQLKDIERNIGDALVESQDVIDIHELHEVTDVPTANLAHWLTARTTAKSARAKRKRPATTAAAANPDQAQEPQAVPTPPGNPTARPGHPGSDTAQTRVPA